MDGIAESAAAAARDLRVMFSRLRRQLRELATDGDLTPSQTAVLNRLWKEGASSASVLASGERVRPQSMATIVAALEQRGLIERAPDPEDGRRQLISLTTAGRRRAESDRQVRGEWLARAIHERYSERERRVILDGVDAAGTLDRRLRGRGQQWNWDCTSSTFCPVTRRRWARRWPGQTG